MTILRAIIIAATSLAVTGCRAPAGTKRPDVTGGRRLEMFVSSEARRFERFRVGIDGALNWAGGIDAQSARFTWSGPLTSGEIDRLFGVIERDGWFDDDPPSTKEPPDTVYSVQIRGPAGRESFSVTGDTPGLVEVRQILEDAARRRLDPDLDALPQAGDPG